MGTHHVYSEEKINMDELISSSVFGGMLAKCKK